MFLSHTRKLINKEDMMDMFMAQVVVKILWMHTYHQIHQVVGIKYIQPFVCQSYLNKMVWNHVIIQSCNIHLF